MRRYMTLGLLAALWFIPEIAWAAGGGGVAELVLVADTRNLSGVQLYFANLYNEDIVMFAAWSVILTTGLGCALGVIMDVIMSRIGIDLHKRSLVEH
ncbi:MAG: hypothetical protein HQK55_07835 [Deltaproteobacteria bacterium]|nr:hypothetical protein [Deltaproteobacteria bacterium]